jgi:predicted acetylornithine/succinylornithine family transaminase
MTDHPRSTEELLELGRAHNSPTYAPADVIMDHGEGAYLYDCDGNGYLDLLAGIAVNCLGYNHPKLTEAIREQATRSLHVSNLFYSAEQIELLEKLTERSFGDRVFLCNAGTEAVEAGLKLARRYQKEVAEEPQRSTIVSMEQSFHGRTMGSITATGQPKYHEGFEPLLPGVEYAEFNNIDHVAEMVDEQTAVVLLEPVQGEGGIRPADEEFLHQVRELCDERGALLMFDEVQAGIGRTGSLFAYQSYDVTPDIMSLAKGLGGGMPIGGMTASAEVFEGWTTGSHASTFGGNPIASVAASTVLDVIEEQDLCRNARERGDQLRSALESIADDRDVVHEVRGRGLMLGMQCTDKKTASAIVDCCREEGVLVNTAGGDTIRLVPPLILSESDVEEGARRLRAGFDRWAEHHA